MISNIGDINAELNKRASALGLRVDCGVDGLFGATIAVIAEAPGEREKQLKLPLIGTTSQYFWDAVRPLGLNRRGVYISNAVKRQLRNADDSKETISSNEVSHYAAILQWELQQLPNLEYIIVLGNYALEAVTGLTGITHHRGSVYDVAVQSISQSTKRNVKVIAMLHPAAIIREPKWEIIFKFDIARLKSVLNGQFKQHAIQAAINPSPREAHDFLTRMWDEKLPVATDIETIGNETACIGFANNGDEGLCINFRDGTSNRFTVQEELDLRLRLQRFVSDPNVKLVMQNGMFDSYWLACKDRIMLGPSYFDTMLAHHTLYPTLPHNLGFLTSQYTTHPSSK